MAGYRTEQINVGSIAAPDVGRSLTDYASMLNTNYQQGLSNTRNAIADQRAKELFDRQTNEYNRQQGALAESRNIAKEMVDTPYAAKFGGTEATGKLDALVNKEAERRMAAGEAPFSAEEAAGIQKTYEANRPYREDARRNISARLMGAGATAAQANAEAEGLTAGMISRADEQSILDSRRKAMQDMYDNQAKANLEAAKMNIEVGKSNQAADEKKAQLVKDYYLGGVGGASGSAGSGYTSKSGQQGGAGGIDDIISKIGISDGGYAKKQVDVLRKSGYSDNQIFNAMNNAVVDTNSTSIVPWRDNDVRWGSVTDALSRQIPGANPMSMGANAGSGIRDVSAGVSADQLMAKVAPYERAGYNPDRMVELLKANAPTVAGKQMEQGTTAESTSTTSTGAPKQVNLDMSKYPGFDMDRYMKNAIKTESNGNSDAKTGSYRGLMQLKQPEVEKMGYDWNQYLKDPKLQDEAGRVYTANNVRQLERNGIPVNDFTVYVAHNQGVGGLNQIMSGHPSKEVVLNMLNQGLSNDLPKYTNGQIDIKKVMADNSISADDLINKYDPVNRYIDKFGKKFETNEKGTDSWPSTQAQTEIKGNQVVQADPYHNASKEEKLKLINPGMKRQWEREDWSGGQENLLPEDKEYIAKEGAKQKAIDDATAFYRKNGAGLIDYTTAIKGIRNTTGMSRAEAMDLYNGIVNNPDNKVVESGTILDRLSKTYSNESDEQQRRHQATAEKVKQGLPLTENEKRWILDMSKTSKNKQVLKELGID